MKTFFLPLLALLSCPSLSPAESPDLEKAALAYANSERTKRGLAALAWDDRLALAARLHSEEMRDLNYMSHVSPSKAFETAPLRLALAGISDAESAENLGHFASNDPADSLPVFVRRIHEGLMKSRGHRANILNPAFNTAGVGIAIGKAAERGKDGDLLPAMWMTQNFVTRRIEIDSVGVEKTRGGLILVIKGKARSKSRLFIMLKENDKESFKEIRTVSGLFLARIPVSPGKGEIEANLCFRRKGNLCAVANVFVVDPSLPAEEAVRSGLGRE